MSESDAVSLSSLSVQQLSAFKSQLEKVFLLNKELQLLVNSVSQLKLANQKFSTSLNSLSDLTPASANQEILVPLTSSMYCSGRLETPDCVLVDVGTGYFLEKTVIDAQKYFTRKMEFIKKQIDMLQDTRIDKQNQLQMILETLKQKLALQK